MSIAKDDIKGYECRHAILSTARDKRSDIHFIKEYIHTKDGRVVLNKRIVTNYEREFWVTKEAFRDHKDKKEYEEERKLTKFKTPQWRLTDSISRALHSRPAGPRDTLKQLSESPYLYGSDILTSCLIKNDYITRFPDIVPTQASLGVIDIETDVVTGTNDIILISLTYKDRAILAINTDFIAESDFNLERLRANIDSHLGELLRKRNTTVEIVFHDTPGQCVAAVLKRAHEWSPDFIVIWNINFDLPRMEKALLKEKYDLAEVFSDPMVPKEYRHFKYIEGKAQKVTQEGKQSPKHWADIWHTVECPAGFYFLDAAVVYKYLRAAAGMVSGYGLDDTLKRHLGKGKLSIPEVDHLSKLAWHQAMQSRYKFDYATYNLFDDIGVELLDELTGDIGRIFPVLCEISDYRHFKSNPRKIVDDLHFFYRKRGKVFATTGYDVEVEMDDDVIGLKQWIVTLPAMLIEDNGLCIIEELPNVRSYMRIHNADLDIEGTYPHIEVGANTAKETTNRELVDIEGLDEDTRREVGINLSGGAANAIELAVTVYKLPTPHTWAMEIMALDAA